MTIGAHVVGAQGVEREQDDVRARRLLGPIDEGRASPHGEARSTPRTSRQDELDRLAGCLEIEIHLLPAAIGLDARRIEGPLPQRRPAAAPLQLRPEAHRRPAAFPGRLLDAEYQTQALPGRRRERPEHALGACDRPAPHRVCRPFAALLGRESERDGGWRSKRGLDRSWGGTEHRVVAEGLLETV